MASQRRLSGNKTRPSPCRHDLSGTQPWLMRCMTSGREKAMLYTIAVILLVLWLLGLVSGYTIGAFIHVLLVIAVVLFLVGLVSGRRVV